MSKRINRKQLPGKVNRDREIPYAERRHLQLRRLTGPGRYICYDCYDEFPEDEMHSLDSKNHICRGCEEKKQARIAAHAERVEKALEEINGNGSLGS